MESYLEGRQLLTVARAEASVFDHAQAVLRAAVGAADRGPCYLHQWKPQSVDFCSSFGSISTRMCICTHPLGHIREDASQRESIQCKTMQLLAKGVTQSSFYKLGIIL